MKVPYLFLQQQNKELKDKILKKLSKDLDRSYFILGPEVKKFEKRFAELIGTKYAVGLNSGTDALFLALKSLDIGKGDEVITVANSFIATANVIKLAGAKPIFVDIKDNGLIDENKIEEKITKKTKAIMPVHLTGKPCNMTKIMKIARKYNLRVIEDSAQAIQAKWKNKNVGSFDIGAFSLHPLKNLSACGDAGVLTTNDKNVYEKIKLLINHGLKGRDIQEIIGYNSRIDELQASILNIKINYLNGITSKRRKNASLYSKLLKNIKGILYTPYDSKDEFSVYHTFVIRVKNRDKLKTYLEKNDIEAKIHYPIPINKQKTYKKERISLNNTNKFSKEILSLPIHQYLTLKQLKFVVKKIKEFYKNE